MEVKLRVGVTERKSRNIRMDRDNGWKKTEMIIVRKNRYDYKSRDEMFDECLMNAAI